MTGPYGKGERRFLLFFPLLLEHVTETSERGALEHVSEKKKGPVDRVMARLVGSPHYKKRFVWPAIFPRSGLKTNPLSSPASINRNR